MAKLQTGLAPKPKAKIVFNEPAEQLMVQTLIDSKSRKKTSLNGQAEADVAAISKLPKTFRRKTVEDEFVNFMQLSSPDHWSIRDIEIASKKTDALRIEFITSDSFAHPNAESEILGDCLFGTKRDEANVKPSKAPALPSHLARLCEAQLLTPAEEKSVFLRMNYLRFRAEGLKMDADLTNSWTLRRIECLLKAAECYRDRIIKSNMRLVISIVKKFVNPQNGFNDLLSDGIVALIRAVDKFDVGMGFRFSTYATQVVRRSTYRSVMEKQLERQRYVVSIHENRLDVCDDQKVSSMSEHRWHDLRSRLSLMLDHLDRREKFIIRARFSLGGHRRIQTLQRLADKLGVSKERIRQLEQRALDKLRGMSEAITFPDA
ncbi:MAG TPA: sigma-70 family RNA polymerase sigma factor [Pirellula sp.]|nr:sigma-70 family RNA polymerase sigma factor [Pirellula sp.]